MIDIINPMIKRFLPFAQEKMGFKEPPKLFLRGSAKNAANPLGKTAFYDPGAKAVTLYITDRHPKDVMRSLSHELVHHTQNCRGDFDNVGEMGEGYAQNDEHLREMEREAYEIGNMCFRDWEDSIKSTIYFEHLQKGATKTMSTKEWKNGELTTLLSEAFGFKFNLDHLVEERTGSGIDHGGDDDEEAKEETEGTADSKREEEGLREDSGREEGDHYRRNRDADDAHIAAIEHHLDALKHDRDYDEDHIDENQVSSGRNGPEDRRPDPRKRPMEEEEELAAEDAEEEEIMEKAELTEAQIRAVAKRVLARLKQGE